MLLYIAFLCEILACGSLPRAMKNIIIISWGVLGVLELWVFKFCSVCSYLVLTPT